MLKHARWCVCSLRVEGGGGSWSVVGCKTQKSEARCASYLCCILSSANPDVRRASADKWVCVLLVMLRYPLKKRISTEIIHIVCYACAFGKRSTFRTRMCIHFMSNWHNSWRLTMVSPCQGVLKCGGSTYLRNALKVQKGVHQLYHLHLYLL